ncbi:MAG: hypothetical protein WDZ79_01985 [Candidatus Paceibacterota bacterium]
METQVLNVLIVEDSEVAIDGFVKMMPPGVNATIVRSLDKAAQQPFPEFTVIALDGNVIGGDTVGLARKIKDSGFEGTVFVMSNDARLNQTLVQAAGKGVFIEKKDLTGHLEELVQRSR